jgi:hypothetical protein
MIIKSLIKKTIAALIILIICGSAFYWYEYRPYSIRKTCHIKASTSEKSKTIYDYEKIYTYCLRNQGMGAEPTMIMFNNIGGDLGVSGDLGVYNVGPWNVNM